MAIISLSDSFKNTVRQAMDDILTVGVAGKICKVFYPPTQTGCINCTVSPVSGRSSNIYLHGGPMPFNSGQTCPLCNGNYFKAVEVSEDVTMTINWEPSKFSNGFPADYRNNDGVIMTRGVSADLQKILNCSYMETFSEVGFSHYRFKLVGEPIMANQLIEGRYFWCYWKRI